MVNSTCGPALGMAPIMCRLKTDQGQVGRVRDTHQPGLCCHRRHAQGPGQPANVADIGLDDIYRVHADDTAPLVEIVILLAARHGHAQRRGDFGSPFQLPIRAGLPKWPTLLASSKRPTSMARAGV